MQAAGLMGLARCPAAGMNHQFTMASQAWGGDPQLPEHRWLAQIKCDTFMTSAHYRELISIDLDIIFHQLRAAANFGDRAHRQIWGPNLNNNI